MWLKKRNKWIFPLLNEENNVIPNICGIFWEESLPLMQFISNFADLKRNIRMTEPQILIAAIIIVFVIAFVITMVFVNAQTSKIIDVNVKLAESQNTLLTQNKTQTDLLEKLEEQTVSQQRELDELYKRLEGQQDKMTELRQQTRFFPTSQRRL